MQKTLIEKSVRALTWVYGKPWLKKLGADQLLRQTVYQTVRQGFSTINRVQKILKPQPAERLNAAPRKDLFDLSLTDEQAMIQESMADFAANAIRNHARDADSAQQASSDFLAEAASLGLNSLFIPENFGGAATESSTITQSLIAESLAHGDMALAAAMLSPLAVVNAITCCGTGAQQAEYLPIFTQEKFIPAAFALQEPTIAFDPLNTQTTAIINPKNNNIYLINGEKSSVFLSRSAQLFIISAQVKINNINKIRLFLVESDAAGLRIQAEPSMGLGGADLGKLTLENTPAVLLGELNEDFDFQECVHSARLLWAALAVGQAQAIVDYVIPYIKERKAFGESIANRQSVAFMAANMALELEAMRLMVWRAASRKDQGATFGREAMLAWYFCGDKVMEIATNGVQLLGGHGFVQEHPVELWYRHARAVALMEGGVLG